MHLRDHEQLGDEPLYYEVDHNSVIYSGSENDYYEAPETRRLRIEAKAVQFLNGNVPYLLSAGLRGPFNKESWTNPWRSKRAERQSNSTQTGREPSVKAVEAARADATDIDHDNLPNTQGTSLYPLPSPETTNPPSARKQPQLEEEEGEFDWIKQWRDKVDTEESSTRVDPFRAPRHDAYSDASSTNKRPANDEWLRKDDPKKRKPTNTMKSLQAESPSRTAAQTRNKGKSGPQSSTPNYDMLPLQEAITSSTAISAFAKRSETTRNLSRVARNRFQNSHHSKVDTDSEDELSMSSTTPPRQPSSLSTGTAPSHGYSPTRRGKRTKRTKEPALQDVAEPGEINEPSVLRSKSREASLGPSRVSRAKVMHHSQQDSSFCFHHVKTQGPPNQVQQSVAMEKQFKESINSFSASQPPAALIAAKHADHGQRDTGADDEQKCDDKPDLDAMVVDTPDLMPRPHDYGTNMAVLGQGDERQKTDPGIVSKTDPRANSVLRHGECQVTRLDMLSKTDDGAHQTSPIAGIDTSTEWSTYINTQDLSIVSAEASQEKQDHDEVLGAEGVPGDESDSDWATVVTNEDLPMSGSDSGNAAEVETCSFVFELGPSAGSQSEWSTFLNTPNLSAASLQQPENSGFRRGTMDEVLENDSDSDWSTCMSASSQIEMDLTGNTSHEPSFADLNDVALEKSPQVSSNSIVALHAEGFEGSPCQDISHMQTSGDAVVKTSAMGTDPELEYTDPSKSHDNGHSNLQVQQEPAGCPGIDRSENLQSPVIATGLSSEATSNEINEESRLPSEGEITVALKIPERVIDVPCATGCINVETTVNSIEQQEYQSPWTKYSALDHHREDITLDYVAAGQAAPQDQSPWSKELTEMSIEKLQLAQRGDGDRSNLSSLAGQALALFSTPQTPWMGEKLPSPDFSLSVKRFSDFMKPSPTKKRFSPSQSILRSPSFGSNILFKTSAPSKRRRHVTFAPLPDEGTTDTLDTGTQDGSSVYVEEDVSYFDLQGKKTATVRVTRPTTRPASPPPREAEFVEAGNMPDHDHKFAKHFEAMSKRQKNPGQRAPRLLPSDSPQTNSSQEVGAMAEAFIQASQTRRKGLESDAIPVSPPAQVLIEGRATDLPATPRGAVGLEDQENTVPVDDVSAVLDNLGDFLDNTWGINLSMDEDQLAEPKSQQAVQMAPNSSQRSASNHSGDPMWALNVNVWAD